MNLEYIDHTITTKRDWTRARELHRKKLLEIVKSPSKKIYNPQPNFYSQSRSRQRTQCIK